MHKFLPAYLTAGVIGLSAFSTFAAVSSADRDFAMKAASGGMAEVQAAQLAAQQATSPQIKQFAQRMITDHTAANSELQQIAKQANIDLPAQPTGKDAAEGQKLRGSKGRLSTRPMPRMSCAITRRQWRYSRRRRLRGRTRP
jgi:predicted outer membrane protein